jgi:hypothetical protein
VTKSIAAALAAYDADSDLVAARRRLGEALPGAGWLHDYVAAVTPLTDAPVEFHVASGLSALAAAAGNRVWVDSWGQTTFPHLWVVLVAPSSFWRKSTSINVAEALVRDAIPSAAFPTEFSREKLLGILADTPAGMLTLKEFGGFLAALGRDYMSGAKEMLTELYDGPEVFSRALKSGTLTVHRPALTLLAATTLDWLESRITEGDLRGGFLARFLFVTARDKASPKGLTGGMDQPVRNRLVRGLKEVSDRPPQCVKFSPKARGALDDWMHGWENEVTKTHHRNDLSGFAVRLQTYALKFAMLYRISACAYDDEDVDHELDEASVRQAIAYCRVLWANVVELIDDEIAITKDDKELRRLRGIIGGGMTRSQALKLSKLKARDFDQFLDTLVQSGVATREERKASDVGLDRIRDTTVTWLAVHQFPNGRAAAVPLRFTGTTREPQEQGNSREPQGAELSSDSSSSSLSLVLSTPLSGGTRTRAGNSNRRTPSDDPAAADDSGQSGDPPEDPAWMGGKP